MLESTHLGHAVICDDTGQIVESWGDPTATIFPRSSCKMLQALPLLESGAADAHGLTDRQIALSCASHQGAAIHTEAVTRWLADLGLSDADLRCGAHEPYDTAERNRLIKADEKPCQCHNNCSGKHSGFLTLNRHLKGGSEYIELDHPVQIAVKQAHEETTGESSPGYGIDGCSAPNFATSVHCLARAMARFAAATGLKRLAHFRDVDAIRRSRLKKSTMFEMDDTPELAAVKAEYMQLAETLWAGTEPLNAQPMKDREIFDFLGYE
jgi:L-asparaginase II